jgi:hypothetical protein
LTVIIVTRLAESRLLVEGYPTNDEGDGSRTEVMFRGLATAPYTSLPSISSGELQALYIATVGLERDFFSANLIPQSNTFPGRGLVQLGSNVR